MHMCVIDFYYFILKFYILCQLIECVRLPLIQSECTFDECIINEKYFKQELYFQIFGRTSASYSTNK